MLSGCGSHKLEYYKIPSPPLELEAFFNGDIKGWGIVQDRKGQVVRRFDVTLKGTWSGTTGTLDEIFHYYDGEKQHRVWTIIKQADGTYTGTAADILGTATGAVEGNTINWQYSMDLPVRGRTYRVQFDDWMWQMHDGVLINRSYIKKFGITMAELTLFMQKVPAK